jgi:hypothetical protein
MEETGRNQQASSLETGTRPGGLGQGKGHNPEQKIV